MRKPLIRIAVTGAAGNIAYNLVFRLAQGELLGDKQPIALHLLEVPEALSMLRAVKMELEDSCFPLLEEIHIGSDPRQLFEGVNYVFLIGAKPRGPNMERKDLIFINGSIFAEQGKALNEVAHKEAVILVLGNPCNTNCLIALHHAPNLSPKNFHALTRLDQHRAQFLLAQKASVRNQDVKKVAIWGNHSSTQVPDFFHAEIQGKKATDVIQDTNWLEKEFIPLVQNRGAEIIKARGKSSAASAAHAALCAMKDLLYPTSSDTFFSSAVYTEKTPYPIEKDLIFSFPCVCSKQGDIQIVKGLQWNPFLEKKIRLTEKELLEERDAVMSLLSG